MSQLFGNIMNLPVRDASLVDMTDKERLAYKIGHRDARHDAADLTLGHGAEGTPSPAMAAIRFAMSTDEGMAFLHCWSHGDFDAIRQEWPEAPETVFIGADSQPPST